MRAGAQVFKSPLLYLWEPFPCILGLLICEMDTAVSAWACVGVLWSVPVALLLVGYQDPQDLVQSPYPLFGLSRAQRLTFGTFDSCPTEYRPSDFCWALWAVPVPWAGDHPLLPPICPLYCHVSATAPPSTSGTGGSPIAWGRVWLGGGMPLILFKPTGIERADSSRQLWLPYPFCGVPLCPAHSSHQAP